MTTATMGGLGVLSGLSSVGQSVSPLVRLGAADPGIDPMTGAPMSMGAGSMAIPGITEPSMVAAAHVVGGAISGAIVGGVASSDWRGAYTGAVTVAGMSGLGLAVFAPPATSGGLSQGARLALGIVGAAGIAGGLWLAYKRKGH